MLRPFAEVPGGSIAARHAGLASHPCLAVPAAVSKARARLRAEMSSTVGDLITAVSFHAQAEPATHLACIVGMTNGAPDGDLQVYDIEQVRSIRWPPGVTRSLIGFGASWLGPEGLTSSVTEAVTWLRQGCNSLTCEYELDATTRRSENRWTTACRAMQAMVYSITK